jgi:hypothetical protein
MKQMLAHKRDEDKQIGIYKLQREQYPTEEYRKISKARYNIHDMKRNSD